MTWTCSECRKTTEYEPEFYGDFPEGWFGVENGAWSAPCCSAKCARALLVNYEEPQSVAAVDPIAADPGTPTPRDAKYSLDNDLAAALRASSADTETKA